jgi:hypothetical protein
VSRDTIPAPPSTDSGRVRLDDIAPFIERVDSLTDEVRGLRTDVVNMLPAIESAVARGVANAVIELTTRVVKLEHRVDRLEARFEAHLADVP